MLYLEAPEACTALRNMSPSCTAVSVVLASAAFPSLDPGSAAGPTASDTVGELNDTKSNEENSIIDRNIPCLDLKERNERPTYSEIFLLLLAHYVQLLGHLHLPLLLSKLRLAPQLLAMFFPEGVQRSSCILHLRQLVLQTFEIDCEPNDNARCIFEFGIMPKMSKHSLSE